MGSLLAGLQPEVADVLGKVQKAASEETFPDQMVLLNNLLKPLQGMRASINRLFASIDKATKPNSDKEREVEMMVAHIQVFLGVIRLVEEQKRDVSSEISHLVSMVKNLPDSLRVKKLIGEIQRMLEAVHTQVQQRGLSQAMLLEQSLVTEKESKLEDLAEACDLIHPPKELELRAFLHETPATEIDKLRLLIIYMMSFSKGLKEDKVRELLKLGKMNVEESLQVVHDIGQRYQLDLIARDSTLLSPMDRMKDAWQKISPGCSRDGSEGPFLRPHAKGARVRKLSERMSRSTMELYRTPDSPYEHRTTGERLNSNSMDFSILDTLKGAVSVLHGSSDRQLDGHQQLLKLREESLDVSESDRPPFQKWTSLVQLLGEEPTKESPGSLMAADIFRSLLCEKTMKSIKSVDHSNVKCVLIFVGGGICHSEISAIRNLNASKRLKYKVFLGSDRVITAQSLLNQTNLNRQRSRGSSLTLC